MNPLREPDLRIPALLQLAAVIAGFVVCLFINVPSAFLLLLVSLVIMIIGGISLSKRQKKLSALCDEIDKILHGAEAVSFDEFKEGELGILTTEIHKMTIRLREQNSELKQEKQFMKEALEDMSHQLRTPLTTMFLIFGNMRDPELTKPQRMEYIQELYRLLSRMQWMLETMLNMSRIEAGAVTFNKETIAVAELIESAIEPLSIAIELKNISVHTKIDKTPLITADRQYITEALVNILKNCMEHTPEGGEITISAFENSIYTGVRITDTGNGIPQKDLPHIFERFYRGTEFSKNGYGIGLAFARKIIASQNGSLRVKNAKPHGAEFDWRMYKTVV
ncbi:MAG: HAMP domain-containing histidine kinase [Oscillospiraceae bacterium]|nr:HAMP domain-containing histidine kinase [Oscillospiraceae bacterium]